MLIKNLSTYCSCAVLAFCLIAGLSYAEAVVYSDTAIVPAPAFTQNGMDTQAGSMAGKMVSQNTQMPAGMPGAAVPGMPPAAQPGQTGQPAVPAPAPGTAPQPQPAQPLPYTGQPIPGEAQPAPAQAPAPTPARVPPPGPARVAQAVGGSSFFFDDADVFEVIQTVFGEVLRVNYIIDPAVKGRVNFRTTTPIPRDKILPIMEIILRLNGIAVVEESGLYRIIQMTNISKEPAPIRFGKDPETIELKGTALLQVVPLTFINSSEMASILNPLLTQGGAIYDVSKKNILIMADTDANIRRLLQVIAMFDVDTYKDANQPKVYVYALQNTKAEHVSKILQQVILGAAVTSTAGSTVKTYTGGGGTNIPTAGPTAPQTPRPAGGGASESLVAPGTKVVADEVNNSLVIYASPADYSVILGAIKQIDTMPRQVMIEAVVASVTLTDNLTYGLRWNLGVNAHKLKISPFSNTFTAGGPLGFQGLGQLAAGSFGYTAIDSGGNVRLSIEADVTAGKAKILSAPHLLVADNREARIQVGSQIPIATSTTSTPISSTTTSTTTAITNTTTSTIQYKDVGTILKVKPQINDSGLISLELSQEVSSANTQNILGTEQFVISKNEVSTNLVAQNGETIVIGGLVNETTSLSRSGIPVLSKLPIFGALFGQTTDDTQRQELLILLTPRVVKNQIEAERMTNDYYELFKNVGKEINLEQHKKSSSSKEQGEKTAPSPADGKAGTQVPVKTPAAKDNGKPVEKPYPFQSDN